MKLYARLLVVVGVGLATTLLAQSPPRIKPPTPDMTKLKPRSFAEAPPKLEQIAPAPNPITPPKLIAARTLPQTTPPKLERVAKITYAPTTVKVLNSDVRVLGPNLSNTPGSSTGLQVVQAGNIYAVWSDESQGSGDIYLSVSRDKGLSFYPPQNLSNSPAASANPAIHAAGTSVFVAWEEAGDVIYTESQDSGDTWKTPRNLSKSPSTSMEPKVFPGPGYAYVAWVEDGIMISVISTELDKGSILKMQGGPYPAGFKLSNLQLLAWGKDVHLFFTGNGRGDLDVFYARSRDAGMSFEFPGHLNGYNNTWSQIRSDHNDQFNLRLVGGGASISLIYETNRTGFRDVLVETSSDYGSSLLVRSDPITSLNNRITYPDPNAEEARRLLSPDAISAAGRLFTSWVKSYATPNGVVSDLMIWDTQRVPTGIRTFKAQTPSIAVAQPPHEDPVSLVAFADGNEGAREISAYRSDGSAFGVSDSSAADSQFPRVMATNERFLVFWVEDTAGKSEIFWRTIPVR
jgi:hypothetical protein